MQLYRVIGAKKVEFKDLINKHFSFQESPKAFEHLASGGHVGKVVIHALAIREGWFIHNRIDGFKRDSQNERRNGTRIGHPKHRD
jgi:hypothetical protein